MTPYVIGTEITAATPTPSPMPDLFELALVKGEDMTIESDGDADVRIDIFGPFTQIEQSVPPGAISRLHVQGVARWNTGPLIEGYYLISVLQNTPGSFAWRVRPWQFTDAVQVPLRKSL